MKQKIIFLLIVFAAFIISLNSSCKYDEIVPETIDPGTEVKFSADIIPIFNESCNFSGCHSFGGYAPDLSPSNAYNSLKTGGFVDVDQPDQSELYQWVSGQRPVPMPVTGIDPLIASTILAWIEQGAQNN